MSARDVYGLLQRHMTLFNAGVGCGDFEPMLEQFTDDAELHFRGVPAGPFIGKAAISAAYRAQPPDDQILVLSVTECDGELIAGYAWRRVGSRAGDMILSTRDGKIAKLVVTFDS